MENGSLGRKNESRNLRIIEGNNISTKLFVNYECEGSIKENRMRIDEFGNLAS